MPIVKKIAAKVETPPATQAPPANTNVVQATAPAIVQTPPKATAPSWMMRGAASKEAYDNHSAQAEAAFENAKRMFRYRLKVGETGRFTWIDGALDADGLLDVLSYYEHTVLLNGKYENFVCLNGGHADHSSEPCPICEAGNKPALVSALTVIDHKPYTIQKGPKTGQVIVDQRKLFVAKPKTMATLRFKAANLKGLAGLTFNVARLDSGDGKSAGVGTDFDRDDSMSRLSAAELAAKYGDQGVPADYSKEIAYLNAAKLIALGAGKALQGPGYGNGNQFNAKAMADAI